jgi:predicted dehydrogenase
MAKEEARFSRRGFGKALAQAGAVAAVPAALAQAPGGQAPAPGGQAPAAGAGRGGGFGNVVVGNYAMSDVIRMGGIGIRSRGMSDLRAMLGDERVKFVAIADVRNDAREAVKSVVDGYYKNGECEMYKEPTELLARKDIDALVIATSDRWHGLMAMWAAQSGKDMYIEKPGAMSINEAYAMAENVKRYGIIYQSGCQRKNQYSFEFAVGLARTGKLGRLLEVHADTSYGLGTVDAGGHGWWPAESPEPDPLVVDWDKWLGPCLWRPYNSNYINRGREQFWDFHAGLLEWASHTVAMAQWAADMEHTEPIEYEPEGGVYRGDGLISRYTIYCTYANGVKLILRNHSWNPTGNSPGSCANRFIGTNGWVETGDAGRIDVSDNLKSLVPTRQGTRFDPTAAHNKQFVDCIRSRTQPRANAEATAHTHVTAHAAWIAAQLNRKLRWDPAKREFINDEEANRMRGRAYREPWRPNSLATGM